MLSNCIVQFVLVMSCPVHILVDYRDSCLILYGNAIVK